MKILFIGDIVGEPGRKILRRAVPVLRARYELDLVIANAENAASGSGLTPKCYEELRKCGIDAYTMGDHVYKRREIHELFGRKEPLCRPANYPLEAPGPDHLIVTARNGLKVAIFYVVGRLFMKPADCPFRAADRILQKIAGQANIIIVDVHAEATSEKQLLLHHLVGRVSAVLGTHTHVPTADASIFPPGTAFISDVGMTGPYDGVIGRKKEDVLKTTLSFEPVPWQVAVGDPRVSAVLMEIDETTGKAESIELLHLNNLAIENLSEAPAT